MYVLVCHLTLLCPVRSAQTVQRWRFGVYSSSISCVWWECEAAEASDLQNNNNVNTTSTQHRWYVSVTVIFFHLRHQTATRRLSFLCFVSSWTDCWPPPDADSSLPDQTLEEHPETLKNRRNLCEMVRCFEEIKAQRQICQAIRHTVQWHYTSSFIKSESLEHRNLLFISFAFSLFYLCWSALFWRVFWTSWRTIFFPEAESRSPPSPAPAAPWSSAPSPLTVTQHHNIHLDVNFGISECVW